MKSNKGNKKNKYIHKINSLRKISGNNLRNEEIDIHEQKKNPEKFRRVLTQGKVQSDLVSPLARKLQKNRQSAKKARSRKKLYVQLLEEQVQKLKRLKNEGTKVEQQSEHYLKMVRQRLDGLKEFKDNQVEIYLHQKQNYSKNKIKLGCMDKAVQELCQLCTSSLIKNILSMSQEEKNNNSQIWKKSSTEQIMGANETVREILKEQQNITKQIHIEIKEYSKKYLNAIKKQNILQKYLNQNKQASQIVYQWFLTNKMSVVNKYSLITLFLELSQEHENLNKIDDSVLKMSINVNQVQEHLIRIFRYQQQSAIVQE